MEDYLRLVSASCTLQPKRKIAIIGLPGTGKWTAAEHFAKEHCWCHIDASRYPKDVERHIEQQMTSFQCRQGVILTGYPTDLHETHNLHSLLTSKNTHFDAVIELQPVPEAIRKERVMTRMVQENTGKRVKYSEYKGNLEGWVCRVDDMEDGFKYRSERYASKDVGRFFKLISVETMGKTQEDVWKDIHSALF